MTRAEILTVLNLEFPNSRFNMEVLVDLLIEQRQTEQDQVQRANAQRVQSVLARIRQLLDS